MHWLEKLGILGVTYRLAQGVVKHIIPAVASTNAVVAAACALEVFKLASSCAPKLDNYMVFNDTDGMDTIAPYIDYSVNELGVLVGLS